MKSASLAGTLGLTQKHRRPIQAPVLLVGSVQPDTGRLASGMATTHAASAIYAAIVIG